MILKTLTLNKNTLLLLVLFCFSVVFLVPEVSAAGSTPPATRDAMSTLACAVKKYMTGTIMQIVVLIGVIGLGIGLFLGKVQMPVFIMFVAAIGVIFGAATIVDTLVTSSATNTLATCPA